MITKIGTDRFVFSSNYHETEITFISVKHIYGG